MTTVRAEALDGGAPARPGPAAGDVLDKPHAQGGLALDRFSASAVLAVVIVATVLILPQRPERVPGPPGPPRA